MGGNKPKGWKERLDAAAEGFARLFDVNDPTEVDDLQSDTGARAVESTEIPDAPGGSTQDLQSVTVHSILGGFSPEHARDHFDEDKRGQFEDFYNKEVQILFVGQEGLEYLTRRLLEEHFGFTAVPQFEADLTEDALNRYRQWALVLTATFPLESDDKMKTFYHHLFTGIAVMLEREEPELPETN
jgi:hypothetical protein